MQCLCRKKLLLFCLSNSKHYFCSLCYFIHLQIQNNRLKKSQVNPLSTEQITQNQKYVIDKTLFYATFSLTKIVYNVTYLHMLPAHPLKAVVQNI